MIDNLMQEKIKLYMNVNEYLSNKRLPTNEAWDKYFIENYNGDIQIEFYKDDFITWGIFFNAIVIKDFICTSGRGMSLFLKILQKAKELNLPIIGYVHFTNKRLLHVAIKRYGFKITNKIGYQYQIIKEE